MNSLPPDAARTGGEAKPRKRGRPSPAETTEITNLILAAASDMFWERPFDAVTIDAVATQAGVKRATVYKRYSDKRALLQAVLHERVQAWKATNAIAEHPKTLEESLKAYSVALLSHALSREGRIWIQHVESAWPGMGNSINRRQAMGYDHGVRFISREILHWTASEAIPAQNPDLVASALMAMLSGWTNASGLSDEVTKEEIIQFAHSAVELIVRGRSAW